MQNNRNVPFLDLVTQHVELEHELVAVFRDALHTAHFIGGAGVEDFERSFAEYCGTKHCVGVGSGTDALRFAIAAAGVKPGEVVVTVPNTFIATTEAISQAGAHPEFVDIDEHTCNMNPEKLREYLEDKCKVDPQGRLVSERSGRVVAAVIPVHLYGQCADMDAILELAQRHGLIVIEDACQAHGAQYFSRKHNRWYKAGSMGKAAAFSFYPGKNLGACGEAGAITTNDEQITKACRQLRDHGQAEKYYHDVEGYNGRLDAIQARILSIKLTRLSQWNEQRRQNAALYDLLFQDLKSGVKRVSHPENTLPVYHLYVIRVENREELREHLAKQGINTAIHYPIPLHLQRAYSHLQYSRGAFPVTEHLAPTILSLPMFPNLPQDEIRRVVEAVSMFVKNQSEANQVSVVHAG